MSFVGFFRVCGDWGNHKGLPLQQNCFFHSKLYPELRLIIIETSTLATEIDKVNSVISYTLKANLESLVLTGTAAINGTGNALNNVLTGNAPANTLNDASGIDTLFGTAADSNDFLIYKSGTGALFYDADGNDAGIATQITLLGVNLALTNADFVVI